MRWAMVMCLLLGSSAQAVERLLLNCHHCQAQQVQDLVRPLCLEASSQFAVLSVAKASLSVLACPAGASDKVAVVAPAASQQQSFVDYVSLSRQVAWKLGDSFTVDSEFAYRTLEEIERFPDAFESNLTNSLMRHPQIGTLMAELAEQAQLVCDEFELAPMTQRLSVVPVWELQVWLPSRSSVIMQVEVVTYGGFSMIEAKLTGEAYGPVRGGAGFASQRLHLPQPQS
ncbi:hypothetical protein [Ferrimonas kyonanensis]|uniref:hypothetical protein n=1 Tax=Ferrimonas kyonanensis TaxID=364763 RepID=UPI0012EB4A05|nr:hypothetical protein [Ferrimonas kyonanensis]